eukprot:COSAG01_NODE_389_length_17708_cov_111.404452_4_plen_79_part_00
MKAPEPDAGYEAVDPSKKSEWLLIDPDHRDRFGHEGDTVIPGAGALPARNGRGGAFRSVERGAARGAGGHGRGAALGG